MLDGKTLWVIGVAAVAVIALCAYMVSNHRSINEVKSHLRRLKKETEK